MTIKNAISNIFEAREAVSAKKRMKMTKSKQRKMERQAKKNERMGDKIWVSVNSQPKKTRGVYVGNASFYRKKDRDKKKHAVQINVGKEMAKLTAKGRELQVKPKSGEAYIWGQKAASKGDAKGAKEGADPKHDKDDLAPPAMDTTGDGVEEMARVGVPARQVPAPPAIPRLENLSEEERAIETRFIDAFEKDPEALANQYIKMMGSDNKFVTDDAKMLSPEYTPKGSDPGSKLFLDVVARIGAGEKHKDVVDSMSAEEQGIYEETRREIGNQRAKYNIAFHQTANAIAKRAFITKLDELAKLDSNDPKREILVTSGGCGAGKGFCTKNVPETKAMADQVGAVWDAAGEQNSTENPWILEECKKRGLKANFVFVDADPAVTWADPQRGVSQRAANLPPEGEGRMVDSRLFAESYALGAKNFKAFHSNVKDDPSATFTFINARGKGIKMEDTMSEEAQKMDADEIHQSALAEIEEKAPTEAIKQGATVGQRIWPDDAKKASASYKIGAAITSGSALQDEYQAFFKKKLEKFGAKEVNNLNVVDRVKFFNEIEVEWQEGKGPTSAAFLVAAEEADPQLAEMQKTLLTNLKGNLDDLDGFYEAKWEDQLKMYPHTLAQDDEGKLQVPGAEAPEKAVEEMPKKPVEEVEASVQDRIDAVSEVLSHLPISSSALLAVEEAGEAVSEVNAARMRITPSKRKEMERKAKKNERMGDKIWVEVNSQPEKGRGGFYIGNASFFRKKDRDKKRHAVQINVGKEKARLTVKSKKLQVKPKSGETFFWGEKNAGDEKSEGEDKGFKKGELSEDDKGSANSMQKYLDFVKDNPDAMNEDMLDTVKSGIERLEKKHGETAESKALNEALQGINSKGVSEEEMAGSAPVKSLEKMIESGDAYAKEAAKDVIKELDKKLGPDSELAKSLTDKVEKMGGGEKAAKKPLRERVSLDDDTLDQLVEMAGESAELEGGGNAEASEEVKKIAQEFESGVYDTLVDFLKENPVEGADPDELAEAFMEVEGGGGYIAMMTMNGSGRTFHDGEWDDLGIDLDGLEEKLNENLNSYIDDTGGGSLNQALEEAAFKSMEPGS